MAEEDEDTLYTRDDLVAMNAEDLGALATEYGIDADAIPTWDEVIDLVLQAQDEAVAETEAVEGDPETMAALAEADAETEETFDELMPLETLEGLPLEGEGGLKDLVTANELTDKLVGQRPRSWQYVAVLWAAQGGKLGPDGHAINELEDDSEAPAAAPKAADLPVGGLAEVDLSPVLEAIEKQSELIDALINHVSDQLSDQAQLIGNLGRSVDNLTAELKVQNTSTQSLAPAPAKAVGAVKKGLVRKPVAG